MMHQFLVRSLETDLLELESSELNHAKKSLRIKPGEQVRLTDGIHVVQALAKGDRDELAIQTSTELGALRFTPWQAKRSIIRWDDKKAQKGIQRWQSIATEAMKQSHQGFLPEVKDLAKDTDFDFTGQLIVLDPDAEQSLTDIEITKELTLVVGPEGGISESELNALKDRGGLQASLGNSVFRTSTAAPAAIATIRTLAGWG
jgi:16S rRNA (uracil1498-N3)-methyltransferase